MRLKRQRVIRDEPDRNADRTEPANANRGSDWVWGTQITAEAARIALSTGKSPRERFEIYERLILLACKQRDRRAGDIKDNGSVAEAALTVPGRSLFDYLESAEQDLSDLDGVGDN
ncbi:MAG TPA: hypothetical protein VM782_22530 [Stellaceae bacterium]|nr:hypothetical protein [Stellaceae bacterium]